jgi:hypothetical protein
MIFSIIIEILKNWWWFFLPVILYFPARLLYLWWVRWEVWYKKGKWILIEVTPPREILKPFRAMENIFSIMWGVYDSANWRERNCEGQLANGPYWFSCEIASLGGEIHFFIRILTEWRDVAESTIYSQYPDAEIRVVDDYTQNVPQDIPNKEWDMYAEDYSLQREDSYPIRTYSAFFEEKPEVVKEEKRLDPLSSVLENLSKIKPTEQFWLQIVPTPITDRDIPWATRGRKLADRIARRKEPSGPSLFGWLARLIGDVGDLTIRGKPLPEEFEEEKKREEIIPPEMKLTPGEREILIGIENKISKPGFKTWIRGVYLFQKECPRSAGSHKIARSYFNQFVTQNMNAFIFWGPTRTRVHYWFRDRRLFMRKRKQFRNYVERLPSYFPWNLNGEPLPILRLIRYPLGPGIRGTIILNTEELATIYHFPSKITIPSMPYVEAKKAGPPSGLPVEETEEEAVPSNLPVGEKAGSSNELPIK